MEETFIKIYTLLLFTAILCFTGFSQTNDSRVEKPLVLIELFTSINCSNCPAAERALTFLQEQPYPEARIITLAFHVDYMNNENIKDEFSDQLFTQRQQIYGRKFLQGTIYTPQMIVDGNTQLVGSDLKKARAAVLENIKIAKGHILVERNEDESKISVIGLPAHNGSTLYLAVTEDKLIPKFKRFGKADVPQEYNSVVRSLKPLGRILTTQDNLQIDFKNDLTKSDEDENKRIILFVQDNQTRKILAVNYTEVK